MKNMTFSLDELNIEWLRGQHTNMSALVNSLIEDERCRSAAAAPVPSEFDLAKQASEAAYEKARKEQLDAEYEKLKEAYRNALDVGDQIEADRVRQQMRDLYA